MARRARTRPPGGRVRIEADGRGRAPPGLRAWRLADGSARRSTGRSAFPGRAGSRAGGPLRSLPRTLTGARSGATCSRDVLQSRDPAARALRRLVRPPRLGAASAPAGAARAGAATRRRCSSRRPAAARRWRASCRAWSSSGAAPPPGLHTLYVSPLKALAADIRRNLGAPLAEMGLAIRVEDRTGDTGAAQRARQRVDPPHILLTTPESLALMLSYEEAPRIFAGVARVIVDEIHALAESEARRPADARARAAADARAGDAAGRAVGDGRGSGRRSPAFLGGGARVLLADPGPEPDIAHARTPRSRRPGPGRPRPTRRRR